MDERRQGCNIVANEIGVTSFEGKKTKPRKRKILAFTANRVLAGIIYSEILGKPKGRKNSRF